MATKITRNFIVAAARVARPSGVLVGSHRVSYAPKKTSCALTVRLLSSFQNGGNSSEATPSRDVTQVSADNNQSVSHQGDPFQGISSEPFSKEIADVLLLPVENDDVEIKPDGLLFLPEIKYRRILNKAFGPGGWAMMPRGEMLHFQNELEGAQLITREYALYCQGRFVSQAVGEHTFYTKSNLSYGKACESAKSNALVRCCKDLGIASELWDKRFITEWKKTYAEEIWCENVRTKDRKKLWRRKGLGDAFSYPWKG